MICPLCGKRVVPSGKNAVIVDGQVVHKRCPNSKPVKTDPWKKALIEEVYNQFNNNAKGYIATTGFNHYKLLGQIKKLHEAGYSYQDQLYALRKVVESQDGFYGYTSVVNQISRVIARKRKREEVLESTKKKQQQEVSFDLGKLMKESDDEW